MDWAKLLKEFLRNEDGFIGSLMGGALGLLKARKDRKNALRDSSTEGARVRAAAESGNFNPLTYLMATGGGGQRISQTGTPPLASIELISGGIQDAVDEKTGKNDAKKERQELENDLLKIEIENLRSGVAAGGPGLRTRGNAARRVGPTRHTNGTGEPYTEGDPAFDVAGNPLTPALAMGGTVWPTDPDTSDAEVFEQRYGDIAQEVAGVGIAVNDYNQYPNRIKRIQSRDEKRREQKRIATNASNEDVVMGLPVQPTRMQRMVDDPRFGTGPIRSVAPTQDEIDEFKFRRNVTR